MVIGQTFVILVRGLDLSISSIMATSAVVVTSFSGEDRDIPVILAIAIAIGVLTGFVNGLLITKRNVSPFLATLAMMIVLQGIRFAYTQGAPSGNVPPLLRTIGSEPFWGFPMTLSLWRVSESSLQLCWIERRSGVASTLPAVGL